jgi:hypothetical protein
MWKVIAELAAVGARARRMGNDEENSNLQVGYFQSALFCGKSNDHQPVLLFYRRDGTAFQNCSTKKANVREDRLVWNPILYTRSHDASKKF